MRMSAEHSPGIVSSFYQEITYFAIFDWLFFRSPRQRLVVSMYRLQFHVNFGEAVMVRNFWHSLKSLKLIAIFIHQSSGRGRVHRPCHNLVWLKRENVFNLNFINFLSAWQNQSDCGRYAIAPRECHTLVKAFTPWPRDMSIKKMERILFVNSCTPWAC